MIHHFISDNISFLTHVERVEVLAVLEHGPPGALLLLGLLLLLELLLPLALGLGAADRVVPRALGGGVPRLADADGEAAGLLLLNHVDRK